MAGGVRYFLDRYKEPTTYFLSIIIDGMYIRVPLEVWGGLEFQWMLKTRSVFEGVTIHRDW